MDDQNQAGQAHQVRKIYAAIGAVLVLIGLTSLVDRTLGTGWLPLSGLLVAGVVIGVEGQRSQRVVLWVLGLLMVFTGAGGLLSMQLLAGQPFPLRLAAFSLSVGAGFGLVWLLSLTSREHILWWAIVPGLVLIALAASLMFTPAGILDLVLFLLVGTGLALLAWGFGASLFGLIIPGCLSLATGAGVYFAWARPDADFNALARTGTMLVIFAFGWGLIVLFSKRITDGFVWWPLIPGGVLAVVGWGLYIAGSPGNAMGFITNTGSVGLIIFGLYLLLLRRGLHR